MKRATSLGVVLLLSVMFANMVIATEYEMKAPCEVYDNSQFNVTISFRESSAETGFAIKLPSQISFDKATPQGISIIEQKTDKDVYKWTMKPGADSRMTITLFTNTNTYGTYSYDTFLILPPGTERKETKTIVVKQRTNPAAEGQHILEGTTEIEIAPKEDRNSTNFLIQAIICLIVFFIIYNKEKKNGTTTTRRETNQRQ